MIICSGQVYGHGLVRYYLWAYILHYVDIIWLMLYVYFRLPLLISYLDVPAVIRHLILICPLTCQVC
jgi:hypothetical protein